MPTDLTPEQHAELNAFCATHVMGWKRRTNENFSDYNSWQWQMSCGRVELSYLLKRSSLYFSPTTSPADAMAVLEKCVLDFDMGRGDIEIGRRCRVNEREWYVSNPVIGKRAYAPTLPLAIVLFAKAFYGKEEK